MSQFNKAIETILKHEGGLVDHPDDPGGITNYGISLRWALREHRSVAGDSLFDVDGDGDVDGDDIRSMPRETAVEIYRIAIWDAHNYSTIFDQGVATKVFDMTVNMGPVQSHKNVQRACRAAGRHIADDGLIGPNTLRALNGADPESLLAATRSEMAGFYRALILRNSALLAEGHNVHDFTKFREGWLRRAYS